MELVIPILFTILITGVILWMINSFIPMDEKFKKVFNVIAIIAMILWVLRVLDIWSYMLPPHVR